MDHKKTKSQIIDEYLSTDEGIRNVAKAAASVIVDPLERQERESSMIFLLKLSRTRNPSISKV